MKNVITLFFLSLLLLGCSSLQKQAFNAAANKDVKTIALIAPPLVNRAKIKIINHPAASVGPMARVVVAADLAFRTMRYNSALGDNKINFSADTQQRLKTELEKNGYLVKTINARLEGDKKAAFMKEYPDTGTDAILDYYYTVQHTATGARTDYIPTVMLYSRMVKSSDKSILYAQHFIAGNPGKSSQGAKVAYENTGFRNLAALRSQPKESVQALRDGIGKISTLMGKDLKR